MHAFGPGQAFAHTCCQSGNGGIACAGNVGHFAHGGAAVNRCFVRAKQGHALWATRYEQALNAVAGTQLPGKGFAAGSAERYASVKPAGCVKFPGIGGNAVRSGVASPVAALGINQHGDAKAAGFFNDYLAQIAAAGRFKQHALGVVRKNNRMPPRQQGKNLFFQSFGFFSTEGSAYFLVKAQQLLPLRKNARLAGGAAAGRNGQPVCNSLSRERRAQVAGCGILPHYASNGHIDAKTHKVARHVGSTARHRPAFCRRNHRHRGLGRNPFDLACNVMIKHHIAHNQYAYSVKIHDALPAWFRPCRRLF